MLQTPDDSTDENMEDSNHIIAAEAPLTQASSNARKADGVTACRTGEPQTSIIVGNEQVVLLPADCLPANVVFSLDIGGTLAKLVYPVSSSKNLHSENVELRLMTFDTDVVEDWLKYIREMVLGPIRDGLQVDARATGTGCLKYYAQIAAALPFVNLTTDCMEMNHCLTGIDILWRHLTADKLLHDASDLNGVLFQKPLMASGLLPCIIANLGSALTIVQVNAEGEVDGIVGGSSQGGLAFLGLGSLLTRATSFEDLIDLASHGSHEAVDLLVQDTAGSEYNKTALDVVVSSFGKIAKLRAQHPDLQFKPEDLASSLHYCITEEMAKTIYLVAKAQNVHTAIICGSFITNNPMAIKHICKKTAVCSAYLKHELRTVFLKYEAYLGAIGVLVNNEK